MKKGALATTALAVGAGATAGTGAAQNDEDEEGEAVIHGSDFYPGAEFEVLAEFATVTRDEFIEHLDPDEETIDDDYEVYVIRFDIGSSGPLGHLMVDNDITPAAGDSGTMPESASWLDPEMNLMELDVTIEPEDDDEDDEDDENDEDDEDDDLNDEDNDLNDEEDDVDETEDDENDDGF